MSDAMAAAQCIDDLKEAGLSYEQARILVGFIVRSQEPLATKADIKALEIRIDGLEARVSGLEARVGALEAKVDALEAKVGALEAKVGALEAKVGALDVKVGSLAVELKAFEARLTRQLYLFGFGITGSMIAVMSLFIALQMPG